MKDLALALLLNRLQEHKGTALCVADEAFRLTKGPRPAASTYFVSNRFDIAQHLRSGNDEDTVVFNDFDFSAFASIPLTAIFYRVSKEKAVTHHVINQAFQRLQPGQTLYLSGYKKEGIKTYIDKAEQYFGQPALLENGGQTSRLAAITKVSRDPGQSSYPKNSQALDDKQYIQLREIAQLDGLPIMSKPGLFGWDKIDQGSAFLAAHLDGFLQDVGHGTASLLDLGCGYGYLSLVAGRHRFARLIATDNNAAALTACTRNLALRALPAQVIADDCARNIDERFDIILCNPPFHRGFDTDQGLTELFLQQTQRHLKPGGRALFVVNQFIGLEKLAAGFFTQVTPVARNPSFKLIALAR